ncbi:chromatin structure-remodeling complex protein BSH-like isoform X2 [Solanum lycopersicum]|uniref:chromatin structure-remodeling complex protein BSH-like isoform X2 n=1 Tax=Solanum lycopersicum TaxID=4081 RepID=UPI000532B38B|nr:chromatin structure-remodeling complex protein BSH-like isoform X2 [Solanum lycopersicum]
MMKPPSTSGSPKNPVKFRLPTAENLVPIRLDIEIDGKKFKDAFTWNASDPDSEVFAFARRTVKDLKLPTAFAFQIAQSIQSQLLEFRSYEGKDMHTGEKVVPIKDMNNFEGDPEEFARTFCEDMKIEDPEVGPAIAIAIREQLYEIAKQGVAFMRESRTNKKGRKGMEHLSASKVGSPALDLGKLFDPEGSIQRKMSERDAYGPVVDHLSKEEVDALEAREERLPR